MNNSLISKTYFPQCLFFSKIILMWKSFINWYDAIRLGTSCETNNTDRKGVNKQKTHMHTHTHTHNTHTHTHPKHSEKDNTEKGQLVWK